MTIPTERTRAVLAMAESVAKLRPYANRRGEHVRIPRDLLCECLHWLRHYPTAREIEMTAEKVPEYFANPGER